MSKENAAAAAIAAGNAHKIEVKRLVKIARDAVKQRLLGSVGKLHKRLGGKLAQSCAAAIEAADDGDAWFSVGAHDPWIRPLLVDYYDHHYRQELARYPRDVAWRGDIPGLVRWLAAR